MRYFKKIEGLTFGKWKVLKEFSGTKGYSLCKCECGSIVEVSRNSLLNDRSTQCQKCAYEEQEKKDQDQMIGKKFGKWTVLSYAFTKRYYRHYQVQCACGHIQNMCGSELKKGRTLQCYICNSNVTNKEGNSRLKKNSYSSWKCMIQRCTNPKWPSYKYYGAKGITVCEEWKDFDNFYRDMGDRENHFSLDRIDNKKGYSKSNCVWKTKSENSKRGR